MRGKSASWSLWRQLPRAELGVLRRAAIVDGRLAAEVDHFALHEALDAEPHSERFADGVACEAFFDDAAEAGVDDAGGSAALSDDGVAVKHESSARCRCTA